MRVVFLEDVSGVANGGDIKEVKNGFARNYLIPKNLAVPATHNNMQRVERLARRAEDDRVKRLEDVKTLAQELDGMQVNFEMRAEAGGRLYGSVTNTMIAEELSKLAGREIDRRTLHMAEPLRELGDYEVAMRLQADVDTTIRVLIHDAGTDPLAETVVGKDEGVDAETSLLEEDIAGAPENVRESIEPGGETDDQGQ